MLECVRDKKRWEKHHIAPEIAQITGVPKAAQDSLPHICSISPSERLQKAKQFVEEINGTSDLLSKMGAEFKRLLYAIYPKNRIFIKEITNLHYVIYGKDHRHYRQVLHCYFSSIKL